MRLLLITACLLTPGCGVDSTRSLWAHRWTGPENHPIAHAAKRTAEVGGKVLITPATVTLDVLTDETAWMTVLYCTQAALESAARCTCECH
ncbi:MAG: hypothetical protein H0W83_14500 [Planctomycetes bacterium]|nr:hypothetical protein [Planctomycetota bacterium]